MTNVKAFALLGFGYLLVFAAFYQGGVHALRPWGSLSEGAPGGGAAGVAPAPSVSPSAGVNPSPVRPSSGGLV